MKRWIERGSIVVFVLAVEWLAMTAMAAWCDGLLNPDGLPPRPQLALAAFALLMRLFALLTVPAALAYWSTLALWEAWGRHRLEHPLAKHGVPTQAPLAPASAQDQNVPRNEE